MIDNSTKEWKRAIYERIRDAYGATTPGELGHRLKAKFDVHRQTPYDWEKGKSKPTAKLLKAICADTGKSESYYLTGRDGEDGDPQAFEDMSPKDNSPSDIDYLGCNLFRSLEDEIKPYALKMLKGLQKQSDDDLTTGMREVKENLIHDGQMVQDYGSTKPYARKRAASKSRKPKGSKPRSNKN